MTIKVSTFTGVAGNVTSDVVVPANSQYKMLFGHVTLITGAGVTARRVILSLYDPTDTSIIDIHSGGTVAALQGTPQHHSLIQGVYRETSYLGNSLQVPIPKDFIAGEGYYFRISIEDGVAGDTYSASLIFDEMHEGARA